MNAGLDLPVPGDDAPTTTDRCGHSAALPGVESRPFVSARMDFNLLK